MGGLFTYSFYNLITTVNKAESLVNTNLDFTNLAEYFNMISPQVDVTLENIMVNDTQYLFAVIKDVILTLDPYIFNFIKNI